MESGQAGRVLGPSGWSGAAGEPARRDSGPVHGSASAGESALMAAGSAGERWPDDDPPGLVEPCSEAGLPELADEPCLAQASADDPCLAVASPGGHPCRAREVLARVGDKWSVYVIDLLGQDTKRFTELHRSINGITGRMLTVTLRGLERDGIVTRTIHPVIPPRVEYALTPMGQTLLTTIGELLAWADGHVAEIEAARASYDARHQPPLG